jgi:hypothetical protein
MRPFRDYPGLALFALSIYPLCGLSEQSTYTAFHIVIRVDSSIAMAVAVAGVLVAAQGPMNLRADVNTCCYRAGTAICAGVGGSGTAPACWPYNKP